MTLSKRVFSAVPLVLLLLIAGCRPSVPTDEAGSNPSVTAPLLSGLGTHTMPVTTDAPDAQRYFDQGMVLAYGFNHAEAARAFRAAQQIDPRCAMCYWGEALVLGPNINAPMEPSQNDAAWKAIRTAVRHARDSKTTPRDRALIEALQERYASNPPEDRAALDVAYADAMREVARRYPEDADVQTLFAEALMDTTPWDYWEKDGRPKPATEELIPALEQAMMLQADHPGANHYYIHAVEAVHPEKGLAAAERLDGLIPAAGHLVHMPAHIYIRVGRYHDAVRVNVQAAAADERYIAECRAQGFYPLGYYPHNVHFLWFAAMMGGEGDVAIQAAQKMQENLSEEMVEVERLRPMLVMALTRFGRWDDVLQLPAPPNEHLYATATWRYGRGLARLHTGDVAAARQELAHLIDLTESDSAPALEQPFFFGHSQIRIARRVLQGKIASATGNHTDAVADLQAAVEIQDALPYMEPPYWYEPVRPSLGAALLDAGRFVEAENVFREDLDHFAENGWSLHGLAASLRAQERSDDAAAVQARFERAWTHADVSPRLPVAAASSQ